MVKQTIANHIKNVPGWRTNRKLVIFSVDDYGNVRLDSKKARENMDKAGLKVHSRFDALDTLETREDLEALYEVLTSVKDKHDNHAVFTPFALTCNINFEAMQEDGHSSYIYELLPETYAKLADLNAQDYKGTWELWQEGIEKGIMKPQLHGREHFNVLELEEKLIAKDKEVLIALKNRSYTSISSTRYPTRSWTGAFTYWSYSENDGLSLIAKDGLSKFEQVYGYKPVHFMAPTAIASNQVLKTLSQEGILITDKPLLENYHLGKGNFKKKFYYTGKSFLVNMKSMVRNVVFEPADNSASITIAMEQINTAFRLNKPAVISSHRVNYCGLIDPKNRELGLKKLKELLNLIILKHPDVEFISSSDLINLMNNE